MTGVFMALSVAAVLLINAGSSFAETVNVSFIHPESYTDAGLQGGYGLRPSKAPSKNSVIFLESLRPRDLKSGRVLALEILKID
jgi:hypothetical protein